MNGKVDELLSVQFFLVKPDLVTPLTGAANQVIVTLHFGADLSALPVNVVELLDGGGDPTGAYLAQFTPDVAGIYHIIIEHVSGQRWGADIRVTEFDVDDLAVENPNGIEVAANQLDSRVFALEHIYTTPTFLTELGYDLAALTDDQKWALIRTVSARIDALTGQWFNADYGIWRVDGKGSPLVQHPSAIPILAVEKVEVDALSTNNRNAPPPTFPIDAIYAGEGSLGGDWTVPSLGVLTTTTYAQHKRALEMIRGHFPGGALNVIITGALGWAEDYLRTEHVIMSEITSASTSFDVASVAGIEARDVLDILGPSSALRVICTTVDPVLKKIHFDAVGARALPSPLEAETSIVRRLGRVPRPIESVAAYLFGAAKLEFDANAAGEAAVDPARIRKESTDGYSYELFPANAGQALLTGSAVHDQTLRAYSAPGRALVI